jgi:secondary thiamine-phosphate synthase enzyme
MIEKKTVVLETKAGTDIVDITPKVSEILRESKIKSGIACVFVPGSTASISTMEYEPNLVRDVKRALEKIAPENGDYEHHKTWGDDNGFSHVRACLMKPGISVPFENRKLMLGTWQNIIILDFDTKPREREIFLTVIGD